MQQPEPNTASQQPTFDPLIKFRRIPSRRKTKDGQPRPMPAPVTRGRDRLPTVEDVTGLSRTSIYRMIDAGTFPPALKLSTNCVGWRYSTLIAWRDQREAAAA